MRISSVNQLRQIERAVKCAERECYALATGKNKRTDEWHSFISAGPRQAMYEATPPSYLTNYLKTLDLPRDSRFADLGSGLGMACFAAATYFEKVVGFEIDPHLHAEAEKIRQKFEVENIEFKNQDFLESGEFPSFDVLYFFHPFWNSFEELMGKKLLETRPGTFIISRCFLEEGVFNPEFFRFHPRLDIPRDITNLFYTFVRV